MRTTRYLSGSKLPFWALLLILILSSVLSAQDKPKNSLADGSWSMQFRISDNFTLSTFDGALLSVKKHLSNKTALRLGVSGTYTNSDEDNTTTTEYEANSSRYYFGVKLQLIKYIHPESALSFYYGIGPNFGYVRDKSEVLYEVEVSNREDYTRSVNFGLFGSWGLEWFLKHNISVLAEYGGGFKYSTEHKESIHGLNSSERDSHRFEFFNSNVNFGVSVYF